VKIKYSSTDAFLLILTRVQDKSSILSGEGLQKEGEGRRKIASGRVLGWEGEKINRHLCIVDGMVQLLLLFQVHHLYQGYRWSFFFSSFLLFMAMIHNDNYHYGSAAERSGALF
jgi:hypothetical protein